MSVTFEPQRLEGDTITWQLENVVTGDQVAGPFDDYQDAQLAFVAGGYSPIDDVMLTPVKDTPSLNVANGNAAALLQALGVDFDKADLFGYLDPTDLLDRLLLFSAVDDPGSDTVSYGGDGSATVIDVGRSAGQLNRYAEALTAVAEAAQAAGRAVQYA